MTVSRTPHYHIRTNFAFHLKIVDLLKHRLKVTPDSRAASTLHSPAEATCVCSVPRWICGVPHSIVVGTTGTDGTIRGRKKDGSERGGIRRARGWPTCSTLR